MRAVTGEAISGLTRSGDLAADWPVPENVAVLGIAEGVSWCRGAVQNKFVLRHASHRQAVTTGCFACCPCKRDTAMAGERKNALVAFVNAFQKYLWIDPTVVIRPEATNLKNQKAVTALIDSHGFDWRVWLVASSGFFTDSYNLFAVNVILPSLGYVYWPKNNDNVPELRINALTLSGSVVGMVLFGILADTFGRRKLYGIELIIVIFGTLGTVQASSGSHESMSVTGWLMFWRFFMGIGIGAEYPLSAVITAEFAPKHARARMMAAVFLMQALGQLAAALVGLVVLLSLGSKINHEPLSSGDHAHQSIRYVDSIWRIVIGTGAIPALIAIIFRVTIPESPRYTLDVDRDGCRALEDTKDYYGAHHADGYGAYLSAVELGDYPEHSNGSIRHQQDGVTVGLGINHSFHERRSASPRRQEDTARRGFQEMEREEDDEDEEEENPDSDREDEPEDDEVESQSIEENPKFFSAMDLNDYFKTQGNWHFLAGTTLCWFFLDVAFYGLGISNPRRIAQIWLSNPPQYNFLNPTLADWQTTDPSSSIYDVLKSDGIQYIITVSIGSVVGSFALIKLIDYVQRKALLLWSFVILGVLFAVIGGSLFAVEYTDMHAVTITLYVLSQLVFNIGPNALTFIISAEIFQTRYRATCHGISSAGGKLGSIIVQVLISSFMTSSESKYMSSALFAFCGCMLLGAFCCWIWLPDTQEPRNSNENAPFMRENENQEAVLNHNESQVAVNEGDDGFGNRLCATQDNVKTLTCPPHNLDGESKSNNHTVASKPVSGLELYHKQLANYYLKVLSNAASP
ncbi:putative metabolite transporter C2H8,02 [Talaromyces islandicus]|uniref:Putative metabolite transporter C2H8,02 n=1 Tax=Talaromyces islandicus TaxID=28573 RepID=A0A0U1LYT2_TALIS|nr:putative metabolite transporter C2H8,02 [Talaromyces islandicus]